MFDYLFGGFTLLVVTVVLLIPFGVCIFYVILGLRAHSIGMKEQNELKRRAALKTIVIASLIAVLVFLLWIVLLIYLV